MRITIFTPAYNRASFLPQVYESLCRQTCKDIEWIVVDDGSSDDTRNVMEGIIENNGRLFEIRYIFKENGGKHTAINRGVKEAKGELFLILDSDDSLPEDAIEVVYLEYKGIANDNQICGVSGLMAHHDGKQIGSGYPEGCKIASSIEQRYEYGVTGDLMEVFKTSVLREFPFPEIPGERFCPEQLVWFRIAQKYKLKCFNHVIYYRDYLDGGLTDNIVRVRMNSPIASMMCYGELTRYDVPFVQKVKAAINYWRFRFCAKGGTEKPRISKWWIIILPISWLMHKKDKKFVK